MIINTNGNALEYSELSSQCGEISKTLMRNSPNDERIIVYYQEPIDVIRAIFAVIDAGKIAVPINRKTPADALRRIVDRLSSSLILSDSTDLEFPNCKVWDYRNYLESNYTKTKNEYPLFDKITNKDKISTIIMSSGTTGDAKYLAHSLNNHYYSAIGSLNNIPFTAGDKWLLSLPLNHIGGMSIAFKYFFYHSGDLVLYDKSKSILNNILDRKITHCSLVPTQLKMLCEDIEQSIEEIGGRGAFPHSIKYILVGGAACPDELKIYAQELKLPVLYSYGSSEMSSQICTNTLEGNIFTCGKSLEYRDIMIGETDEILVRGETLFKGYIREDLNVELPLQNGWFATNDHGRFDDNGDLIVLGRRDDMIICGGENIYPREIEIELMKIPEIAKCKVISEKDSHYGEIPVALIELKSQISEQDISDKLSKNLPKYKLPRKYIKTKIEELRNNKDQKLIGNLIN